MGRVGGEEEVGRASPREYPAQGVYTASTWAAKSASELPLHSGAEAA